MRQLALPVAHRRWLWNAVACSVLVSLEIEWGAFNDRAWWALCASVPLAAVNWTGWWKTRPPKPRPDYARIAELEHDLFGVRSKPQSPPSPGSATTAR